MVTNMDDDIMRAIETVGGLDPNDRDELYSLLNIASAALASADTTAAEWHGRDRLADAATDSRIARQTYALPRSE